VNRVVAIVGLAACAAPVTAPTPPDATTVAWTLSTIGEVGVERGDPGVSEADVRLYQASGSGDLLILGVHLGSTSQLAPPSGFTEITAARAIDNANDDMLQFWYAPAVDAGVTTVSLSAIGRLYAAVVWDFSVAGPATLDIALANSDQPATTRPASPTIAMPTPGEIIVAAAVTASRVVGNAPSTFDFGDDSLAYQDGWSHLITIADPGSYYEYWETPAAEPYCAAAVAFAVAH